MPSVLVNVEVDSLLLHFGLENSFDCVPALFKHPHGSSVRSQHRRIELSELQARESVFGHLGERRRRYAFVPVLLCDPVPDFSEMATPARLRTNTGTADELPLVFDRPSNSAIQF